MKKVAICMTVYNRDGVYARSFKNLFEQKYKNIKFYVVDDCSTDDGLRRLIMLSQNAPEIFKLYKTKETNYVEALNLALRSVEDDCDYITWCDSDDFISPEKLEEQVRFLDENPEIDVVACTTAFGKNQILAPSRFPMNHDEITKMIKENNGMNTICHFQSCMFRRSVLDRFTDKKYFYDEYIGGRAGEGFLYTLFFTGCKFASINTCAYFYNIGVEKNSLTNTIVPVFANNFNLLSFTEKKNLIFEMFRKYNPIREVIQEIKDVETTPAPKKRGRPKKTKTEQVETTPAPKKRGRPKKIKE